MAKSLKDLLGEKKNPYLRSKADQKFAADFTSDTTIKKDRATEHEGNFKALGVKSVENEKERHGYDTPDDNADGTDLDPGTFKNLEARLKSYKKYTNIAEGGRTFPKDGKAHIDRLAKKHGLADKDWRPSEAKDEDDFTKRFYAKHGMTPADASKRYGTGEYAKNKKLKEDELKEGAYADLQRKRKKEAKALEKNTDTSKAEALGLEAFQSGKKRVPAQHKDFVDHLATVTKGKPIGHGLPHIKAWNKGWDKGNLKEGVDPALEEGVLAKMRRFLDKATGLQKHRIVGKANKAYSDASDEPSDVDKYRRQNQSYQRANDPERVGQRYMSGGKKKGGPLFYHSKNGKKTPIYEEDLNEASKAELLSRYASQVKEVMVEISGLLNDYVKHQKNGYYIDFYNIKSNLSQLMDIRDSLTGSVESAEKDAENKLNSAQSISKSVYETYTFSRTKSPAKDSKRLKRIANNAEKKAADEAEKGKPWSMSNVRMHQNMMADALKQRSEVIKDYLAKRKTR